jgi:hypothetical protein
MYRKLLFWFVLFLLTLGIVLIASTFALPPNTLVAQMVDLSMHPNI